MEGGPIRGGDAFRVRLGGTPSGTGGTPVLPAGPVPDERELGERQEGEIWRGVWSSSGDQSSRGTNRVGRTNRVERANRVERTNREDGFCLRRLAEVEAGNFEACGRGRGGGVGGGFESMRSAVSLRTPKSKKATLASGLMRTH
jgi:hypothetical protein